MLLSYGKVFVNLKGLTMGSLLSLALVMQRVISVLGFCMPSYVHRYDMGEYTPSLFEICLLNVLFFLNRIVLH